MSTTSPQCKEGNASTSRASATEMKDHAKSVAFASSAATVITKSVLHPLDTLKCRFQLLALSASSYSSSFTDPFFIRRTSSSSSASGSSRATLTRAMVEAAPEGGGRLSSSSSSSASSRFLSRFPFFSSSQTASTASYGGHDHRFHAWHQVRHQFKGKWGFQYLYGGLPPKLLLYVPYQTLYISTYDTTRYVLMTMDHGDTTTSSARHHAPPKAWHTVISSVSAELMSCLVRVPMEAMKMWVQSTTSQNSVVALRQLWTARHGKWIVLKGLVVPQTFIHDIPYSVCQWLAYEWLRPWARQDHPTSSRAGGTDSHLSGEQTLQQQVPKEKKGWDRADSSFSSSSSSSSSKLSSSPSPAVFSFFRTLVAGGGAGLVASVITIPLDHIRTRALVLGGERLKQLSSGGSALSRHGAPRTGVPQLRPWRIWKDIVKPVYRDGGILGFYRGGAWRVVWVTTNMALYFPIFEVLRGGR